MANLVANTDAVTEKDTGNSDKKEESLEDLVTLLFKQMRENPPEWTAVENQSEDLKELTKMLNLGDESATSQNIAAKKNSVQEDGTIKKDALKE